jgi:hypothetical protein
VRRHVRSPFLLVAIAICLFVAAIWYARSSHSQESVAGARQFAHVGCVSAATLFHQHRSGRWLTLSGTVGRTLSDAYGRLHHQRFILRCQDGMTILIVNDVSLGQRVPVVPRARIAVHGQYEWDSQGGLVHFTHHENGAGPGGWILFGSRVYQ